MIATRGLAALVALLSIGGAVLVIATRHPMKVGVAVRQTVVAAPRLFSEIRPHTSPVLQRIDHQTRGGFTRVDWYDSSLGLTTGRPGTAVVALFLDGQQVSVARHGSSVPRYSSAPVHLTWIGRLAPGEHRFEVRLAMASGRWSAPDVRPPGRGVDGIIVTDGW